MTTHANTKTGRLFILKTEIVSSKKMNPGRKFVSLSEKQLIINSYKSKIAQNPRIKKEELLNILSKELAIIQRTVSMTIFEYDKFKSVFSPNRKKSNSNISDNMDESDKSTIRRIIHNFWFEKDIPTLNNIYSRINTNEKLPSFTKTTLYSLIQDHMGFESVKRTHNSALVEKDDIILHRRNYLEAIMKYRCEGRPIYYMDETSINIGENASLDYLSKGYSTRPTKNKDKWLVVAHIGNENGSVENGLYSFELKGNTKDYQVEMNSETIFKWLNIVIPHLKDFAVIIMDDTLCHSLKHDQVPTSATEKSVIIEWLRSKGEVIDRPMVKAQLMAIVQRIKPLYDTYVIDDFFKKHNMTVLRQPSCHCELNPLEMVWSVMKNHVNMYNNTYELNDGLYLIKEGINKVNSQMWKHFISIVVKEEKKFWDLDFIVDNMLEDKQSSIVTFSFGTSDESDNM